MSSINEAAAALDRVKRIKGLMAKNRIRQIDIANETGASRSTVSKWLSGDNVPAGKYIVELAGLLKTTPEYLLYGEGSASSINSPSTLGSTIYSNLSAPAPDGFLLFDVEEPFSSSAGHSINVIKEQRAISKKYLARKGINADSFKIVVCTDDSMQPLLRKGDDIGIDTSIKDIVDGGVYELSIAGYRMVKQVFVEIDGSLRLHSPNDSSNDKIVPVEQKDIIRIIGKQVYRAG